MSRFLAHVINPHRKTPGQGGIAHAQLILGPGVIMLGSVRAGGDPFRPLTADAGRPSATPRKAPMSLCLMRMRSIAAQGLREPRSPSISKRRPWRSRLFLPRPRRPSLEHRHLRSLEDDVLRAAPKSIVAFHSASPTSPPRPAASPAAATTPAARTWKVVRPRPLRRRAPSRAPKETAARPRPRR